MNKTNMLISILLGVVFTGCGVAYKKYGDGVAHKVGYSDFEIGQNKYKVTYTGAVGDEPQEIIQYTYKRAKELCLEKGFNEYVTSNPTNDSRMMEAYTGGSVFKMGQKAQPIYSLDVECK